MCQIVRKQNRITKPRHKGLRHHSSMNFLEHPLWRSFLAKEIPPKSPEISFDLRHNKPPPKAKQFPKQEQNPKSPNPKTKTSQPTNPPKSKPITATPRTAAAKLEPKSAELRRSLELCQRRLEEEKQTTTLSLGSMGGF